MKTKIFIMFFVSILFFSACDILRLSRFEVASWTPGGGYHSEVEEINIILCFSGDPDKSSVERNFSLTCDGDRIRGKFLWSGRNLTYSPLTPLEINKNYIISVSSEAHDINGLSMDETFYGGFTTRPDNSRPVLLSCYPPLYENIADPEMKVRLEYSEPVSLKTLYENVSFYPSMNGLWKLDDNGNSAVFSPAEPWTRNNRYEIRISSSLTDNNGMNTGNDFTSIFTTGNNIEKPYLLNVMRIAKDGAAFELIQDRVYSGAGQLKTENQNWEKDDKFLLVFSKPVDSSSVKNYISADDAPNLVMDTPACFTSEIIFRFENPPVYDSRFSLRIKSGIKDDEGNESKDEYLFRVVANGKHSRPPVLTGIRMPMAPGNETDHKLKFFGESSLYEIIPITNENYPSGESIKTWIELYFETAEGASVDLFSLMELFRMETSNNVVTFSARQVKDSSFSANDPHPGMENNQRIEINGNLVNSTFFGIINFQIASGLRDNLGNRNNKPQRISLIK